MVARVSTSMVPRDHVPRGVLGDLARHEDEISGTNARMKRQIGLLVPIGYRGGLRIGHVASSHDGCFEDIDAADAVAEIDQAAIVDGDVIGRYTRSCLFCAIGSAASIFLNDRFM